MKKVLLSLAVAYAAAGLAQTDSRQWVLEEPNSGTTVPIGNVGFLLSSDWQDTFTIVCKDGTTVNNAETVNFVQVGETGINAARTATGTPQLDGSVKGRLTLTGCPAGTPVSIYDTAGRQVRRSVAANGQTVIDVSSMTPGVYILKAGDTAIKFTKK